MILAGQVGVFDFRNKSANSELNLDSRKLHKVSRVVFDLSYDSDLNKISGFLSLPLSLSLSHSLSFSLPLSLSLPLSFHLHSLSPSISLLHTLASNHSHTRKPENSSGFKTHRL